jgi:alpha-tubulin suppressor-like RCC1 family protein
VWATPVIVTSVATPALAGSIQSANDTIDIINPKEPWRLVGDSLDDLYVKITSSTHSVAKRSVLVSVAGPASFGDSSNVTVTTNEYGHAPLPGLVAGSAAGGVTITASLGAASAVSTPVTVSNVAAWGADEDGSLGNTAIGPQSEPIAVELAQTAVLVESNVSGTSVIAITEDGSVHTWGEYAGELPRQVTMRDGNPLTGAYLATVGRGTFYVATEDAGQFAVYAWGENSSREVGQGNEKYYTYPQWVEALPSRKVISMASGSSSAYVVFEDGELWGWGSNASGALAMEPSEGSPQGPQPLAAVNALGPIQKVAAGEQTGYAIGRDNKLWAWGRDNYHALGNSQKSIKKSTQPVLIALEGEVSDIAANRNGGYAIADGEVYQWGWYKRNYRSPDGTHYGAYATPIAVNKAKYFIWNDPLKGIVRVSAGEHTGYAFDSDGAVWAWGIFDDGVGETSKYRITASDKAEKVHMRGKVVTSIPRQGGREAMYVIL